jgi:hypothetical protein
MKEILNKKKLKSYKIGRIAYYGNDRLFYCCSNLVL